jgi:hypothetical protein
MSIPLARVDQSHGVMVKPKQTAAPSRPLTKSSLKKSAPRASKRSSPKIITLGYKNALLANHPTGQQHLCRLSIISDRDHSVMDRLVDISELETLPPGATPFSPMTMPLGDDWQVSLVVDRKKGKCA